METLGFFEETTTSSTNWGFTVRTVAAPVARGAVDPFADWQPAEIGRGFLTGRVRWSQVVGVIMICAGLAGIAAWLYVHPAEVASQALDEVRVDAAALASSLAPLQTISDRLTDPALEPASVSEATVAVDTAARLLFATSAGVAPDHGPARSSASTAATEALSAVRLLSDTIAYRETLLPRLGVPTFETDPHLIEIETAAYAFSEWRSELIAATSLLPVGAIAGLTLDLEARLGELESMQTRYIDALRSDDFAGAEQAITDVEAWLVEIEAAVTVGIADAQTLINERIEASLAALEPLLG